jgi:hypothetical protein
MGMTDFDRTLKFFHIQDEHDSLLAKTLLSNPNANAWNKVVAAFQNAQLQPVLA